jgi:uncharacterized protein (DUF362 family)
MGHEGNESEDFRATDADLGEFLNGKWETCLQTGFVPRRALPSGEAMSATPTGEHGMASTHRSVSRRGFLLGAGAGLAAGVPLAWYGLDRLERPRFRGRPAEVPRPEFAMPGPFPGRVVEVHNPHAVRPDSTIHAPAVQKMMRRGMCALTGADDATEAWRRLFHRGDVVGIKVNPVGRHQPGRVPDAVGCISSPAVLMEVVRSLKEVGIPGRDIIVFERYADEFREAGYEGVLRERGMEDVRWHAAGVRYNNRQLAIDGHDDSGPRDPKVVGYDPDVFVSMGFSHPDHDQQDDRRFRSHMSLVVSRMINKIITIPCLKDHGAAGITGALKDLSHGMNNNVARSHLAGLYRFGGERSGPNQCNTFIPTAASQRLTRQKATLHILDGLIGVYQGGPGMANRTWSTWPCRSLFFATDPVALDLVSWEVIDAKRVREGWLPVARMERQVTVGRATEAFDRRQPEHVLLAGILGLGNWRPEDIEIRRVQER